MTSTRAPKQWCLGKNETVTSFENWRQNLQYTLSLDSNFAQFLVDGATWSKKGKTVPLRGFLDDTDPIPENRRCTAHQKVTMLELMLGQIANYCPVISRNTIVKNSTSIENIWQSIRMHFGFQSTGAHFIDFSSIKLEPDERPEDLYQRLMAFTEDSMLLRDGSITHHGQHPVEDEDMSPSLENMIVLTWLRLVNKDLPLLVRQRYGTELRSKTLASIKPEISQALETLLDEIRCSEDSRIMRTIATQHTQRTHPRSSQSFHPRSIDGKRRYTASQVQPSPKSCPLCRQAGRSDHRHFLSTCSYLPEGDRKFMSRARQVVALDECLNDPPSSDLDGFGDERDLNIASSTVQSVSRRVQTRRSPTFNLFCDHHTLKITVDSGAETNMIRASLASYIGAKITKSCQLAVQADGQSPLTVLGETRMVLSRDSGQFILEALVVEELEVDVLGGVPFMTTNDISVRPAKNQIIFGDGSVFHYGSVANDSDRHTVRHTQSFVLRAPSVATTIWPGQFVELDVPTDIDRDIPLALEPRVESPSTKSTLKSRIWLQPHIISNVGSKVRILNSTNEPKVLKKNEHFCQVSQIFSPISYPQQEDIVVHHKKSLPMTTTNSSCVKVDPDSLLPPSIKSLFHSLLVKYDDVFEPSTDGYNGAVGPFEAIVNMGPVQPPQRKGRLPQYSKGKLDELQQKFDELEASGVFRRPEDIGVVVEYVNPSFLVKKPNGAFRLVTAFADVGRYSKPQPSLMPDVDSILRSIAQWKYIIVSDLSNAFYQIPLSRDSMKYCGVVTPYHGVRVYTRCAMGMPGSETALEELMCRILGDLLQEGYVAKLADDLYCGGNSPEELLENWRRVLQAFHLSGMKLSASRTVIAPKTTTILGWVWSQGSIRASQHRIATLSTCSAPETVYGLRSFLGAYKVLAHVIPRCADLLAQLEDAVAGRQSQKKIQWTDDLHAAFSGAQASLSSNRTIILPRPSDFLWIVTDGAVKSRGIGSTLYAVRDSKPHLAGFFSAKLRKQQVTWLPCEIEALSIATAVKHFSPYIIQADQNACVLTDSKPCVQAHEKLCRGEFSASPRVSTFLSTVSRYQVFVRHLSGSDNLPSDFASRNAQSCVDPDCQICKFIAQTEDSVVRNISVQDIISGNTKPPFTSRTAWSLTQVECPDLRRTHAHLVQGTRPSKKATNIKDVRQYLQVASIAKDGLLVVPHKDPLSLARECIIVPRLALDGLITALHLKLDHPSCHQLKKIVHRYFFGLDMDKVVDGVSKSCHLCASLKTFPKSLVEQTTSDPPASIGVSFTADIIKRNRQLILAVRETVTSFTVACLVEDERRNTLRDALILLCINMCPLDGPSAVIRTDPAPGFLSLVKDELLARYRLNIEVGRIKNVNKNPVAERAIQELEDELLRQDPSGGNVTPLSLAAAIARLNSRIRFHGLSAREMWTQRDQFTGDQLPVSDRSIVMEQYKQRQQNHPHSEKSKSHVSRPTRGSQIGVGDLVYLVSDRNKHHARDRYLVVSVDGEWCNVRKFCGSQLRSTSYRVKLSECYSVPAKCISTPCRLRDDENSDDDLHEEPQPPFPPVVPPEIYGVDTASSSDKNPFHSS